MQIDDLENLMNSWVMKDDAHYNASYVVGRKKHPNIDFYKEIEGNGIIRGLRDIVEPPMKNYKKLGHSLGEFIKFIRDAQKEILCGAYSEDDCDLLYDRLIMIEDYAVRRYFELRRLPLWIFSNIKEHYSAYGAEAIIKIPITEYRKIEKERAIERRLYGELQQKYNELCAKYKKLKHTELGDDFSQ